MQGNEAVLGAAAKILGRYRPDPERQPHIVARIDDLRHAGSWRGGHSGTPGAWFVDALNPAELTACTLVSRVLRAAARQVVLCGDSTLTMAVLLELARRAWEQAELVKAAAIGRATALAVIPPDGSQPDGSRPAGPAPLPVERLMLMDPRAGYVAIVPPGGPAEAARFQRTGIVQARELMAPQSWIRRSAEKEEELRGEAGDWRVRDSHGDVRTVGNAEFRQSHEPLDGDWWRRTGMFRAWRAREELVIRTKEGTATANPGDWVVEGAFGERWPISDEQFKRTYRASGNAG